MNDAEMLEGMGQSGNTSNKNEAKSFVRENDGNNSYPAWAKGKQRERIDQIEHYKGLSEEEVSEIEGDVRSALSQGTKEGISALVRAPLAIGDLVYEIGESALANVYGGTDAEKDFFDLEMRAYEAAGPSVDEALGVDEDYEPGSGDAQAAMALGEALVMGASFNAPLLLGVNKVGQELWRVGGKVVTKGGEELARRAPAPIAYNPERRDFFAKTGKGAAAGVVGTSALGVGATMLSKAQSKAGRAVDRVKDVTGKTVWDPKVVDDIYKGADAQVGKEFDGTFNKAERPAYSKVLRMKNKGTATRYPYMQEVREAEQGRNQFRHMRSSNEARTTVTGLADLYDAKVTMKPERFKAFSEMMDVDLMNGDPKLWKGTAETAKYVKQYGQDWVDKVLEDGFASYKLDPKFNMLPKNAKRVEKLEWKLGKDADMEAEYRAEMGSEMEEQINANWADETLEHDPTSPYDVPVSQDGYEAAYIKGERDSAVNEIQHILQTDPKLQKYRKARAEYVIDKGGEHIVKVSRAKYTKGLVKAEKDLAHWQGEVDALDLDKETLTTYWDEPWKLGPAVENAVTGVKQTGDEVKALKRYLKEVDELEGYKKTVYSMDDFKVVDDAIDEVKGIRNGARRRLQVGKHKGDQALIRSKQTEVDEAVAELEQLMDKRKGMDKGLRTPYVRQLTFGQSSKTPQGDKFVAPKGATDQAYIRDYDNGKEAIEAEGISGDAVFNRLFR